MRSSSRIRPLKGLDVAVLHRSARCDVMPIHTMILRPAQHRVRGELGAIVGNDHLRLAARADEHRQLAMQLVCPRLGVLGNCRQTYARHIIDNVEDAGSAGPGRTGHGRSRASSALTLASTRIGVRVSDRFPPSLALADGQPFFCGRADRCG